MVDKIFVLGLPHSRTIDPNKYAEFSSCAFTAEVWNLCRMLTAQGYHVVHLGTEGSNPICAEQVDVVSYQEWNNLYGSRKVTEEYEAFKLDERHLAHKIKFMGNITEAIKARCGADYSSIICCPLGQVHKSAVESIPQFAVETGIGYQYPWSKYRVYESYAWYHYTMGAEKQMGDTWYHTVIPCAFDPTAYGPVVPTEKKQNYFVMACRLHDDKGVNIGVSVARALGIPIKLIGQGDASPYLGPGVEYRKPMSGPELRELLRYAKGLFQPTRYVEPFGKVTIDAALSGCPTVVTDFGVFTETIVHGMTGYRCRTWDQFMWAAKNVDKINPYTCHDWCVANYSLDRVGKMYKEYFDSIMDLNGKAGWYTVHPERTQLDWMKMDHSMLGEHK